MKSLNFNYNIANFVSRLNIGIISRLRSIKIRKLQIFLRLLKIFYKYGIIRSYCIKEEHILIYFKYHRGRNVCSKLSIVSKPSKRCYWTLGKLSKNYNNNNFSGFYILSSQKGLTTSDHCLLKGHRGGEVLIKAEL
jgi:ribosomal protein S8